MNLLNPIRLKIAKKLEDPEYFARFFMGRAQDEIACAIRDLREKRGLTQQELADICDMKQSAVSRIEDASYASWNFTTLWRVAKALRARWRVVLEPMEHVLREYQARERRVILQRSEPVMGRPKSAFAAQGEPKDLMALSPNCGAYSASHQNQSVLGARS